MEEYHFLEILYFPLYAISDITSLLGSGLPLCASHEVDEVMLFCFWAFYVQVCFSVSSYLLADFYHFRSICICSKIAIFFLETQCFLFEYLIYLQQETKMALSLFLVNHSELMYHELREQRLLEIRSSQRWLCCRSEWT